MSRLALMCCVLASGILNARERVAMSQEAITNEEVVQFLERFEALAEQEDFLKIEEMVHERAYFRFNDGDFIGRHIGPSPAEREHMLRTIGAESIDALLAETVPTTIALAVE